MHKICDLLCDSNNVKHTNSQKEYYIRVIFKDFLVSPIYIPVQRLVHGTSITEVMGSNPGIAWKQGITKNKCYNAR